LEASRQGEIRDRTFENQSFRASGLSLITTAIVHWNTVYLDRAVRQLHAQGAVVPDDPLAHVAPLGWRAHRLDRRLRPWSSPRQASGSYAMFAPRSCHWLSVRF
jgi:hypothetical protein